MKYPNSGLASLRLSKTIAEALENNSISVKKTKNATIFFGKKHMI